MAPNDGGDGDNISEKALKRLSQQKGHLRHAAAATTSTDMSIPPFSALPLRQGDPPYSAWGLYGSDDQLGTLNRLIDPIVAQAAKNEIRTGARYATQYPHCLLEAQKRDSRMDLIVLTFLSRSGSPSTGH